MFFRRALYYWQFTAAILLPVWVVLGRGLFGSPTGWDLALYIVLGIILGFSLLAVAALTVARKVQPINTFSTTLALTDCRQSFFA